MGEVHGWVTHVEDLCGDQYQVDYGHDPGFYGNDKENHELCVGVCGCEQEDQA